MRILVTSTPGTGHLNALLPLCSALQAAGHEVLVVTGPESCAAVASHGLAVRAGGLSSDDRRLAFEPRLAETMALHPRQRRGMFFAGFFADIAAPAMRLDLIPVVDDFRPHVMISERGELAAGPMAAARGVPYVTVGFSGALPQWAEELLQNSIAPLWVTEARAVPTMEQINGDLYLHPFPPSFGQEPSGDHVRPMRAVPVGGNPNAPVPWLDELGSARPLVYLTAGTEPPAAAMFPWAAAVAALARLDVDVLATTGPRVDPGVLGVLPSNVRVERFVPQQLILERAAVVMSHAGAGSLLGAAAQGLPQVVCPMRADQWENADAATVAGIAITLELEHRAERDIAEALDRVTHDAQFAQATARVAAEIAAMPSPADHVATIEALAK